MSITVAEVEKVSRLAKLSFSEKQKQKLAGELDKVVAYIDKLNHLDLTEVSPTTHVLDMKNVLREDRTEQWLTQGEALENAPRKKGGYFSVPKVLDDG